MDSRSSPRRAPAARMQGAHVGACRRTHSAWASKPESHRSGRRSSSGSTGRAQSTHGMAHSRRSMDQSRRAKAAAVAGLMAVLAAGQGSCPRVHWREAVAARRAPDAQRTRRSVAARQLGGAAAPAGTARRGRVSPPESPALRAAGVLREADGAGAGDAGGGVGAAGPETRPGLGEADDAGRGLGWRSAGIASVGGRGGRVGLARRGGDRGSASSFSLLRLIALRLTGRAHT